MDDALEVSLDGVDEQVAPVQGAVLLQQPLQTQASVLAPEPGVPGDWAGEDPAPEQQVLLVGLPVPLPDATDNEEYSGKFVLRIPKSLHRALARKVKEKHVNLDQYATYLLRENNAKRAGLFSPFRAKDIPQALR
ncbi:MAG: type II toxin-antitoxin system HicB family antitoxin [Spirochaetaceae bacterium]|nr:type II toxin-antitoxin system HicB family antitoxin [Spirochaetaceae bacterium]